jgi:membrane protein
MMLDYSIPRILKKIVNGFLYLMPGYLCTVESLTLHPISGYVEISGLTIRKKVSRETSVPFLFVPAISFFSSWKDLFMGHVTGRCVINQPQLTIDVESWMKTGLNRPPVERRHSRIRTWRQRLRQAAPFLIDSIEVLNGRLKVIHLEGQGTSTLELDSIQLIVRRVTNAGDPATISGTAHVLPQGTLQFSSEAYPFRDAPAGKLQAHAEGLALTAYNDLFRSHLNMEVVEGVLSGTANLQAANGVFSGDVIPVVERLRLNPTAHSGFFKRIEIGIANLVARRVRVSAHDRIAVKINVSGTLENLHGQVNALTAFFRNAFALTFNTRLNHLRYLKGGHVQEVEVQYGENHSRRVRSMVKEAGSRWLNDDVPQLAAALSYYTCFSLAPLLLLVTGIAGLTFGRDAIEGQLYDQLAGIMGTQSAQTIQSMVASAWKPSSGIWAVSISVITLLFGAFGVLSELKDGLNRIMRVDEPGDFVKILKTRMRFLGFILGIGFLLLVSLIASAAVATLGHALYGVLPFPKLILSAIDLSFSVSVITVLFAMIFKYLPSRSIAWKPVWVGSFFSAVLFTGGKFALGFYIARETVGSSYGAAGSVLIILLWVYYSALISYFGAEFTNVYAERTTAIPVP